MFLFSRANLNLLMLFAGILLATAEAMAVTRDFGPHTGYMSKVEKERNEKFEDIEIFIPPPEGPTLREQLFDDKLTFEFVDRYHQKFGYTEPQRAYLAPNSHTYYSDLMSFRGTAEEQDGQKRRFADYMVRRLGEHHFDRVFRKKDSNFNAVYVVKQTLTTSSATISRKVKFKGKYNISSNTANLAITNPYVNARLTMEFDDARESIISLSRMMTPTIGAEAHFKRVDGILTVVVSKQMAPRLNTSLTTQTFTNRTGVSVRESLLIAGLSWVY